MDVIWPPLSRLRARVAEMPGSRLTRGEFATPGQVRDYARFVFLSCAAKEVPRVLTSLRDDVLPVYVSVYEQVIRRSDQVVYDADCAEYELIHGLRPSGLCRLPAYLTRWQMAVGLAAITSHKLLYPDLLPLRHAIEVWAADFHLQNTWVYDAALLQLECWRIAPQLARRKRPSWQVLRCSLTSVVVTRPFEFRVSEDEGWEPTFETRARWTTRIRAAFERELEDYLNAAEANAQSMPDQVRTKSYRELKRHLEWLAVHQLTGKGPKEIARLEVTRRPGQWARRRKNPVEAIRKELPRTAELIGLDLLPGPGSGRPPGSKTLHTRDHSATRSRPHKRVK